MTQIDFNIELTNLETQILTINSHLNEGIIENKTATLRLNRVFTKIEWLTDSFYKDELKDCKTTESYSATNMTKQQDDTHSKRVLTIRRSVSTSTAQVSSAAEKIAPTETDREFDTIGWIDETPVDNMIAVGGNIAWIRAIELAEHNESVEGLLRTADIAEGRNRDYTKIRQRALRAGKAEETEARNERKELARVARKAKSKKRAKISLPSQR